MKTMKLLNKKCCMVLVAGWLSASLVAEASQDPAPYKSVSRYSVGGQLLATISPDPDGSGPRGYPAVRYTYNAMGQVTYEEQLELHTWKDEDTLPKDWHPSIY